MIIHPQPMPTLRVMAQSFELERVDFLSPEAGGMLGSIAAGFPRWLMKLTFNAMSFAEADVIRAFVDGQRGSQRRFVAFDMDRQRPSFYQAGRPFQATPAGWSQTILGDGTAVLQLTGLMPGQVVSLGDYTGFAWPAGEMTCTRAIERAVASAGGVAAFAIEPPVPPVVPSTAVVTLTRAGCLMKLVTDETKLTERGLRFAPAGGMISAAQDLLRP